MFSEDLSELRGTGVDGVRAQGVLSQKFIHIVDKAYLAEFALILECKAMGIGENKEHSRMLRRPLLIREILKRTGHAEMQSQPEVSVGAHKQMFAVSTTRF